MNIEQSKISKLIKIVIALTIILISGFCFIKSVKAGTAVWEVESNMIKSTPLGVMPLRVDGQYYFCEDRGLMLRTGRFDYKFY